LSSTYYYHYQCDKNCVDMNPFQGCMEITTWNLAEQYTVSLFGPNESVTFMCITPEYCQSNKDICSRKSNGW